LSLKEVKEKLFNVWGNEIKLLEDSYVKMHDSAIFFHVDYGQFVASPHNVINHKRSHPDGRLDRIRKTNIEKYGVEYPIQNREIFLRAGKKIRKIKILIHWKTGEEIVCRGSYEISFIKWLNKNEIDFIWQTPFLMPNGWIYICDCYLPEEDKYIEVKGYFWPKGKQKWDWFHKEYPNSELWDKKKLKELGIL